MLHYFKYITLTLSSVFWLHEIVVYCFLMNPEEEEFLPPDVLIDSCDVNSTLCLLY